MKNILISLLIFFTLTIKSYTQNTYLVNQQKEIYRINSDNSLTFIITIQDNSAYVTDLAISTDNNFYVTTSDSNILEVDINDGSTVELFSTLSTIGAIVSLTCSNDNELYFLIGPHLYKFNISTNNADFIYNVGFTTPGDLTFYKGNLIFPNTYTQTIKAYNLANNGLVDIFCLPSYVDPNTNSYLGITNLSNSCSDHFAVINANNGLYEIDFENNLFQNLNIDLNGMIIYGMASTNENLSSPCNEQLENVNCNLSVEEFNWLSSKKIIFPNPVDNTLNFNTNINNLNIEIYTINGQLIMKKKVESKIVMVEDLTTGFYLVKIISKFGYKFEKIIKN